MSGAVPASRTLTARERDCIKLLLDGRDSRQAAAALGISRSTFDKHLASVRTKLSVRRTVDALLMLQSCGSSASHSPDNLSACDSAAPDQKLSDFSERLRECEVYEQAWEALITELGDLGFTQANLGIVAEPYGQFSNGANLVSSTFPGEIIDLYRQATVRQADPIALYVAHNRGPLLLDGQAATKDKFVQASNQLRELSEAYLDIHMQYSLTLPQADRATNASYAVVAGLSRELAVDFRKHQHEHMEKLRKRSEMFWTYVQSKRLLQKFSNLTSRQREALVYAARGFSMQQIAEHMSVSLRSAEKTMAGARDRLGASTTAAAVYRSIVYRALF